MITRFLAKKQHKYTKIQQLKLFWLRQGIKPFEELRILRILFHTGNKTSPCI